MKPLFLAWLQILAPLAIEVGLVALLVVWLARWTRSAVWRRTFCQAGIAAALALTVIELSGSPRVMIARVAETARRWTTPRPGISPARLQPTPTAAHSEIAARAASAPLPTPEPPTPLVLPEGTAPSSSPSSAAAPPPIPPTLSPAPVSAHPHPVFSSSKGADASRLAWLWLIWAAGTLVVTGRILMARLFLLVMRLGDTSADAELAARVQSLRKALGVRRKVRLIESARLTSPIAFGVIRPTIGWPGNFQFSTARQDAMLAHELAHLAAHDPFWCLVSGATGALLWWHPAVWWLRRHLHVASEMAADEASLVVAGGPNVLAQCLVELGARMVRPALPGQLGVASFRSHLGRRVERLISLEGRSWAPPGRWRVALAGAFGPMALAAIAVVCTAWVAPQAFKKGDSMKTMELKSLTAFALLAVATGPEAAAPAAQAGGPNNPFARPTEVATTSSAQNNQDVDRKTAPIPNDPKAPAKPARNTSTRSDPFRDRDNLSTRPNDASATALFPTTGGSKRGARIESKLKEIVLAEVNFDGLPLSEVIRFLSDECRKHDPEKEGINFLLNPNQPAGGATLVSGIDPTTGLPINAPQEAVDISSIVVKFSLPLRNVTMKEALDAVVRVADRPISYTLEDYAVVFALKPQTAASQPDLFNSAPFSAPMAVSTFKVDTNSFIAGLETAFGIRVEPAASGTGAARSQKVQAALKELLTQLGITVTANKAVFYNDLTGIIMVKGTLEDMETVTAAMETLGGVKVGQYGNSVRWPVAGN